MAGYGATVRDESRVPTRTQRHAIPGVYASYDAARVAVQHGATSAEAISGTFLMNAGPATVCGARAYAAFTEFYADRAGNSMARQLARDAHAD